MKCLAFRLVTGLTVATHGVPLFGDCRCALDFLEMRPVSPSLRFKDVMLM